MAQPRPQELEHDAAADDEHPEGLGGLGLDHAAASAAPAPIIAASAAVPSISGASEATIAATETTSSSSSSSSSTSSAGATMQFQGNDGSQISIPSRVVNRRPSDDSIQRKAVAMTDIGGLGQTQTAACQKGSSSSPTNTGATPTSTSSSVNGDSSPRSHKRMKLEDDYGAGDKKDMSCGSDSSSSQPAAAPSPAQGQQQRGDMLSSSAEDTAEEGNTSRVNVSSAITTTTASTTQEATTGNTTSSSSPSLPPPPSSSSSSSTWRTDGTKPKRPMTSYNYFFREQRNLIKSMGLEAYKSMMEGKGEGGSNKGSSSLVGSSEGGCSGGSSSSSNEGTSTTTTTTTTTTDNPPSSSQAKDKDTTKPPLQVMAKIVAHYWKTVPSTDLRRYQELARQEQKRYRSEMKEYKAMLRGRQEQLDRQREEQLSLAAANNAAASAAAGGLGLGHPLAGSAAFSSSSSSWTPEQMVSIFNYLNQAQMEQPPPNSTNGSQEQELIFNAQNAMIGQLQNQIRSLQQTLPHGPTTTTTTTTTSTSQEAHVSVPSSTTTAKGKSKSPASSRGLLGRLEAQASLMRLQIERGKARSLGAVDIPVGEQRVEPTGTGADEGTNLAPSFPNVTSTQAYSSNFGGDTQDPSLGSASRAAISLLASTVPTDNDNHNNNSNNGGVFTQPPTTGIHASLSASNLNLDHFQQYPPFVAPSSNPTPPQGWSSANPLSGVPSVPMGNFPQDCPMPPQLTAGLPFQQQLPSTVSSISGISNGMAQQAQYQSQGSSISALSDHLSNAESADERSSSEETLDAFSIAQMLFGSGVGKKSDTK